MPAQNQEDLRLILAAVRKARAEGKDFDAITRVEFESSKKAHVRFTWSGGFHGGGFTLEKKSADWVLTDEFYAM